MTQPTPEEKKVIASYVSSLKVRGFVKMDSKANNQTMLYNRFTKIPLPFTFLKNDFNTFLYKNKLSCSYRDANYIAHTLPHVVGSIFKPASTDIVTDNKSGLNFVNTWSPYEPEADSNMVLSPLFHEFFERLFPCAEERNHVLQWLSHMVQKPHERPSYHLLLTSDTGCGKGFLYSKILLPIVKYGTSISSYDKLFEAHSVILSSNILLILDDTKTKSTSTMTKLKSALTEETLYFNPKGEAAFNAEVFTRVILFSNELRPLHLQSNERRWYAPDYLKHRENEGETQQFLATLNTWIDEAGSLDAIYHFFKSYDITTFNHKFTTKTDTLKAMIGASIDPELEFLKSYCEGKVMFSNFQVTDAIKSDGRQPIQSNRLSHLLRDCGFATRRVFIDGKQKSLFCANGVENSAVVTAYNDQINF